MAVITTATSLTSPLAIQYPGSRRVDVHSPTRHLYYVGWTGTQLQVYRSTNNGASWAAFGGATTVPDGASIVELGSIHVDYKNRIYLPYRVNAGGQDRVYLYAGEIRDTYVSPHTTLLVAAFTNGGTAGSVATGMAPAVVRHSDGRTTGYVAISITTAGYMGVYAYGFTIPAVGQPSLNSGVISGTKKWLITSNPSGGHQVPSVEYELSPAHTWITFGRTWAWCVKLTWNGSGWTGPTTGVRLSQASPEPPATDSMPSAWRNPGWCVAQPYQNDPTFVVVWERNQANTRTTPYLTPVHPAGVVRHCTLAINSYTRDIRVYAVGTSDSVLYYTDYISAAGSWSGWSSVGTVAGTDDYNVRRNNSYTSRFDVLYMSGAASPYNINHVNQVVTYAPYTPTWKFTYSTGSNPSKVNANGAAKDVGQPLDLEWSFSDPDVNDAQSAWALSRQIGAGTIAYFRVSDSTWQATEQKNIGGVSARTLAAGWGSGTDANHSYKVKVWDTSDTPSVYSPALVVVPSVPVLPTITSPASGVTITTDEADISWAVAEQTAYKVRIRFVGEVVYESAWMSGATNTFHIPYKLTDGWTFSFEVNTLNLEGLESGWVGVTAPVDVFAPPDPTLTVTPIPSIGAIRVTITNPNPPLTNTNPDFEVNTTPWTVTAGTLTRDTAQAHSGSASGRINPSGSGVTAFAETAKYATAAGATWTIWVWMRPTTVTKPLLVTLRWFTSADVFISSTGVTIPTSAMVAGQWQEVVLQATAPATTAKVSAAAGVTSTPTTADIVHVDDAWLMAGAQPKVRYNALQRRKEFSIFDNTTLVVVVDDLPINATYDDWTARSGYPYEYRAMAVGDNGVTGYSAWTA